ncbi:MAG TPA: hypothetical protein VMV48_00380 [Gallionellaceae bacterium]|nr:hypothetical protein [Gallionellaceae bacterium]
MSDIKKYKCGFCHLEHPEGAVVCQAGGCGADIVYGASNLEISDARALGALKWGFITLGIIYVIPQQLNAQFSWSIPNGWGVGVFGLVVALGLAFWGATKEDVKIRESKRGAVRYYRKK